MNDPQSEITFLRDRLRQINELCPGGEIGDPDADRILARISDLSEVPPSDHVQRTLNEENLALRAKLAAVHWEVSAMPLSSLTPALRARLEAFEDLNDPPLTPKVPTAPEWRVFQLDDYEWWVGYSLEDIILQASADYGSEIEMVGCDPHELTEADLDTLRFREDGEDPNTGKPIYITFREQLARVIAEGITTPTLFASTEC